MSEWLKERAWKARIRPQGVSRVRIPLSPPDLAPIWELRLGKPILKGTTRLRPLALLRATAGQKGAVSKFMEQRRAKLPVHSFILSGISYN